MASTERISECHEPVFYDFAPETRHYAFEKRLFQAVMVIGTWIAGWQNSLTHWPNTHSLGRQ
jgi:hypothetical protein